MEDPPANYEAAQHNHRSSEDSTSPLLRPMSTLNVGTLCTILVVGLLATCWCVLDYWNREISHDLFGIGNVRTLDVDNDGVPEVVAPFGYFSYPLTLAFLQFFFMGVFFMTLYVSLTQERPQDLRMQKLSSDKRWSGLVVTHVFSTFWLQSLMMPTAMLSISLYAASRAIEIPVAAAIRMQVLGPRLGRKSASTIGLAFAAACVMFFSYAKMADCVCIWSGSGVALTGLAFWIISLLLLAMPAANAVCQEAIMLEPGMHPLLLLALQNIFAALVFSPILLVCHLAGWEDVIGAFAMILSYTEVFMMVLWLCAQVAATSLLCITLIVIVDSFWMIALRALRVLFWAICIVATFYVSGPGVPVSIACPLTSFWSFVLMFGVLLGMASTIYDRAIVPEESADKSEAPPVTDKQSASTSTTP